jgi:hypothetical protein
MIAHGYLLAWFLLYINYRVESVSICYIERIPEYVSLIFFDLVCYKQEALVAVYRNRLDVFKATDHGNGGWLSDYIEC